jgi:hypothetical protein
MCFFLSELGYFSFWIFYTVSRLTSAERRNSIGFNLSILRHSEIWGAIYEALLNTVHKTPEENGSKILINKSNKKLMEPN